MSPDSTRAVEPAAPLSVAELTATVNDRLSELGRLAVVGEVTGITKATSGHIYFKLKDRLRGIESVVSAVVWRSAAKERLKAMLVEGAELVCHGKLDVYAPRGTYSLIVDRVETRGLGALMQRFEELKQKLKEDGWFDRSRELTRWPRPVGIVTSRDTAALQDFLRTRDLRWPDYPVRLAHAPVQGPGASAVLADQIKALDASGVDVIVVTRGGGSLEDLWAFNELPVLEAIRAASVPVVSGVGHETDTTLTDFVADHRCHTPTDAAQLVIPDRAGLIALLERSLGNLGRAVDHHFTRRSERLESLSRRPALRRADKLLEIVRGRLDRAAKSLVDAGEEEFHWSKASLLLAATSLCSSSPRVRLQGSFDRVETSGRDLLVQARARLATRRARLDLAERSLATTSPFAVLDRGYSITRDASGRAIRSAGELSEGVELETVLASGRLGSTVTRVELAEEEA